MSEGNFINVRPFIPEKKGKQIDEASDTYDTAEWLIKNVRNNNGSIGVTGVSYPGFYATMAILADHPAIKAVSPQAPVSNWFLGDDWHHNGAFFLIDGNFKEAYIYMTGENAWKEYSSWPPPGVTERTIFFNNDGSLSFNAPVIENTFIEYISDPAKPVPYMEDVHLRRDPTYMDNDQRFASRRPDVVVYQTDVLTEDITLSGTLSADLYVSTSGTDADFIVKIIDVFPDQVLPPEGSDIGIPLGGYQMLVRGEVMRGKFRNSFEEPAPFVPGEITRVSFNIPDLAHKFMKGHRLMVQVQSSWFPLVDRNPQKFVNIYECDEDDFQKASIRIYSDKKHPSGIKVMIQK